MRYIGVDLAWGEGNGEKQANETGLALLDDSGRIHEAGWVRGVDAAVAWVLEHAAAGSVVAVDAPLVIPNATGMRQCEKEVGRCYGRWQVSANASNAAMGWQAGVRLRERLEEAGFSYLDGTASPAEDGRGVLECYPYTTIVGMWELGYDTERPRYKRLVPGLPPAEARAQRAAACDDLLRRMAALPAAETPLDLRSHPVTALLLDEPSPEDQTAYKHREDLLDAVVCAWTAAIWHQRGAARTQVLGASSEPDPQGRRGTIVAPARPEQRLATPAAARPRTSPAGAARDEQGPSLDRALAAVRELQRDADRLTSRLRIVEHELAALRRTRGA
jgi:predicted RNase H-like nuclease